MAAGLFVAVGFTTSVSHGPRDTREVALTLDDGPHPTYTPLFLQLLQRLGIPATFFVIGRRVEWYPDELRRLVAAGVEIGNHGYSHRRLGWMAPWQTAREIARTDELIRAAGYTGPLPFRAPFGERFGWHTWVLLFTGRTNYLYDVEPRPADYHRNDPDAMAASALERTQGGAILLFHDGEGERVESLEAVARLVPQLQAQGFRFVPLSAWSSRTRPSP